MPAIEVIIPVGAVDIKLIDHDVEEYPVDPSMLFTRTGENGAVQVLPLFHGDEGVGEVLEGHWRKSWSGDIDTFTAVLSGGTIRLGGDAAVAGVGGEGWINSHMPFPMLDKAELTIAWMVPTDDTGAVANRDIRLGFYLIRDKVDTSPRNEADFLRFYYSITDGGLIMYLEKEVSTTNTTLFTGSTYDDASGRDTGNLEATILRFVFHNGVNGASSPSDVRHVHVYMKQAATITLAEAATEYQLTTSPYDISDLQFKLGFPCLRIWSESDTYFGDTIGSGNEALIDYIRVDLTDTDFNVKCNPLTADIHDHIVEVYDGSPDAAVPIKVEDEDHVFAGDIYLQNGLTRVWVDELAEDGVRLYNYVSGAYTEVYDTAINYYLGDDGETLSYPTLKRIIKLTDMEVVIEIKYCDSSTDNDDYYIIEYLTMRAGKWHIERYPILLHPLQYWGYRHQCLPTIRFGVSGDEDTEGIGDADLAINEDNDTLTDNTVIGFDDDGLARLIFNSFNYKPDYSAASDYIRTLAGMRIYAVYYGSHNIPLSRTWLGSNPFSLVANLFREAEDITSTGATVVDATASGGNKERLNASGEHVYVDYVAGTHLNAGRYKAIWRAYDSNQVADDYAMYVENNTDGEYRNEEGEETTKTLTASWAFYTQVFDITDQDVSDGDTIRIYCDKATAGANDIDVDDLLIVPWGDGEDFPQDITHNIMREGIQVHRLIEL